MQQAQPRIAALFTAAFAGSEGSAEGALLGALARRLMAQTLAVDLRVFAARNNRALEGVAFAATYGDPGFHERVGFSAISEEDVPTPFPLQHPEGWPGQRLNNAPKTPFAGASRCVPAFDDPTFW